MRGFLGGLAVGVGALFVTAAIAGEVIRRRGGVRRRAYGPSGLRPWEVIVGGAAIGLALLVTTVLFFDPGVAINTKRLTPSERSSAETAAREAGLKLAAGILAVGAGVIALRRYGLSRLEHILEADRVANDRYARSIELLGSDREDTVTGALYGLEELGRETGRYQTPIIETVAAVIRRRSPANPRLPSPTRGQRWAAGQPRDQVLQSAMDILRRRSAWSSVYVNFDGTDLSDAMLEEIDLRGAQLVQVDLRGARLDRALLQASTLIEARVQGASFREVDFSHATILGINFSETDLADAVLDGVTWRSVQWPAGLVPPTPEVERLALTPEQLRRRALSSIGFKVPGNRVV